MEQKGSSLLYVMIFQERYVSSFHGSGERKYSSSAVIYIYTLPPLQEAYPLCIAIYQ